VRYTTVEAVIAATGSHATLVVPAIDTWGDAAPPGEQASRASASVVAEQPQSKSVPLAAALTSEQYLPDGSPQIYIDEHGDVWLDDRRLDTPMPKLVRRCLEYIWSRRHTKVSYDELLEELYGTTLDQRGDPRSSMEKLIRRLRGTLEPGNSGSRRYIDVQLGVGYVLRNYRDHM
jgi:hypothetical protein